MSLTYTTYRVSYLEQPFERKNGQQSESTARITFLNEHLNTLRVVDYGIMEAEDIYASLEKGDDLDLDQCFIKNFSLSRYRQSRGLDLMTPIQLGKFSAVDTFFESDQLIDFSFSVFQNGPIDFTGAIFGRGNLSFYKCLFGDINLSFEKVDFGHANLNFQFTEFGTGSVSFQEARIGNGQFSFVNANFGDGKVNFKEVQFGKGNVDFHFSKFGKGDISFDKTIFEGLRVDFRKAEFGDGKLDFRRTDFGNATVWFDECEAGVGRKSFRKAIFGSGNVSFHQIDFGEEEIIFDTAIFGSGSLSFLEAKLGKLSLHSCHFNNYLDLRVTRCHTIDLSDCILREIVDLKPGATPVALDVLNITGVKALGKIFLDWKDNRVHSLIRNQKDTTDEQKAEQFRTLKEEFRDSGQYNDEDEAYVAFKRFELYHIVRALRKAPLLRQLYGYPLIGFRWLVFDKMGRYATDPARVLISMIGVYLLFSLVYMFHPHLVVSSLGDPDKLSLISKSFYHSAITFLTIGYGDYYPSGHARWVSAMEGFSGLFLMSYFTVAFVRKILR